MLELGAHQGGHAHAAVRRVLRLDKFSLKTFFKKVLGGVLGGFLSSRAVRGGKRFLGRVSQKGPIRRAQAHLFRENNPMRMHYIEGNMSGPRVAWIPEPLAAELLTQDSGPVF